jgi:hypothetical protein
MTVFAYLAFSLANIKNFAHSQLAKSTLDLKIKYHFGFEQRTIRCSSDRWISQETAMGHEIDKLEEVNIELSEEAKLMAAARKVVQAGIWLIRNGYGQMSILPYASPSGCYWRCEYHPAGRPSRAFYRYSTGCGSK